MTDQLPQAAEPTERVPLPEIRKFPDPLDQQLVDALLRDPLTPASHHIQRLTDNKYKGLNSAAAQAWKRLQKPEVKAYMQLQQERIRRAADLEKEDLLQMLTMVMRTDISMIASWDESGRVRFKNPEDLPTHALRSIKKLKTKTRYFKGGESETTTELELYSQMEAIELFAKVSGIMKGEGAAIHVQNGVIVLNSPMTEAEALKGKTVYEG